MPCCGNASAEDIAEVAAIGRSAMSDEKPAAEGRVALYTTVPGMEIHIPPYGVASNETPCLVPASCDIEDLCAEGRLATEQSIFPPPPAEPEDGEPEGAAAAADGTFHAAGGKVYHDSPTCTVGNDIEPENRRAGKGGLRFCTECRKLARERE